MIYGPETAGKIDLAWVSTRFLVLEETMWTVKLPKEHMPRSSNFLPERGEGVDGQTQT